MIAVDQVVKPNVLEPLDLPASQTGKASVVAVVRRANTRHVENLPDRALDVR